MQENARGVRRWFFGYAQDADCVATMLQEAGDRHLDGAHVAYFAAQEQTDGLHKGFAKFERVQDVNPENLKASGVQVLLVPDAAYFCNLLGEDGIQMILDSGIDIYGVLYLFQLSGMHKRLSSIVEKIPVVGAAASDAVFDDAEEIRFVERESHFTDTRAQVNILAALRDAALHRMADRVDRRQNPKADAKRAEHVLVCISPSPANARVLRSAAQLARSLGARLTALYVETQMRTSQLMRYRLEENINYARSLGASVINVYGADVPLQVAEYAKIARVTKIMIGRTYSSAHAVGMTHRLLEYAPDVEVYIVPDEYSSPGVTRSEKLFSKPEVHIADLIFCFAVLAICTLIGFVMRQMHLSIMNVAAVYILGVVIVSWRLSHPLAVVMAVPVYILMHAFFEVPAGRPESFAIAVILAGTAIITGAVMDRSNRIASAAAKNAYNTSVLLSAGQIMYGAQDMEQIGHAAMRSVQNLMNCAVLFCYRDASGKECMMYMDHDGREAEPPALDEDAAKAAAYAFSHREAAGRNTQNFKNSAVHFVPLVDDDGVNAVLGMYSDMQISRTDDSLLSSLLLQISVALEKYQTDRKREQATVAAENEMLRANLLRAISHDLRTPLTGIIGSANLLMSDLDEDVKNRLAQDICQDAQWLVNLVENVLSVTRIEDGRLQLHLSPQIAEEIVDEALTHVMAHEKDALKREDEEGFLLVRADPQLLTQVIVNLVNNAFNHGGDNVHVCVRTYLDGDDAVIEVEDDGVGVPDEAKDKIFDLFYTAQEGGAGDRRKGLGVGLSLCKSIIGAHEGTITLTDAVPHGAKFTIRLKAIELMEQEVLLG
ncbi:MAG: hypothetical protein J6L88_09295 [Clostridia bacterium]|nr:hypothetical protein [Clostridia bacterium]